jgi:hypothetical protein
MGRPLFTKSKKYSLANVRAILLPEPGRKGIYGPVTPSQLRQWLGNTRDVWLDLRCIQFSLDWLLKRGLVQVQVDTREGKEPGLKWWARCERCRLKSTECDTRRWMWDKLSLGVPGCLAWAMAE